MRMLSRRMAKTIRVVHTHLTIAMAVASGNPQSPSFETKLFALQSTPDGQILFNGKKKRAVFIGRAPELKASDIHINDMTGTVSEEHGYFIVKDGTFYYYDNKSTNGTWVKRKKDPWGKGQLMHSGPGEPAKKVRLDIQKPRDFALGELDEETHQLSGRPAVPVVKFTATASEEIQEPALLSAAEMMVTIQSPEGPLQLTYLLEVFSGNYLSLWSVRTSNSVELSTKHAIQVGRGVTIRDLLIPHNERTTGVSTIHGEFAADDGLLFYRDLNSTNGSWVDDDRVQSGKSVPLANGFHKIGLSKTSEGVHPVLIEMNVKKKAAIDKKLPIPAEFRKAA
ncbi:FHA domain-containing protein [Candidatus Woesearchaeota archaeon]|nr:FHA domain-containing protein [Candidatus Woesearchaeota archaeon]